MARLISEALRSRGADVDWATSVCPVEADPYALVIIDLRPTVADEVLLQAMAGAPNRQVMVISDTRDSPWAVKCFHAGAVDFMAKPFMLAELVARVKLRLRQAATAVELEEPFA